jgi:hypothetical protein
MPRARRLGTRTPHLRLAGEATRNVAARPTLAAGLIVATAGLLIGTTVTETSATIEVRNYERGLINSGYGTLLIEQDNPLGNSLDSELCDELDEIDGVTAAVGLREPEQWTLWTPGGPPVPVREVSGDVIEFFRQANAAGVGAWRTAQTLVDLDSYAASPQRGEYPLTLVQQGSQAQSASMALTVRLTSLGAGSAGNMITIGVPEGPVSACALFVPTAGRDLVTRSVEIATPVLDGFSHRWALPSAEQFETPIKRFHSRPSRFFWAGASACFSIVALLYLRLRRSELALYAVAGLRTGRIWFLAAVELAVVVIGGSTIALLSITLLNHAHDIDPGDARVGWTSMARTLSTMVSTSVVAVALSAHRAATSALDALKDR